MVVVSLDTSGKMPITFQLVDRLNHSLPLSLPFPIDFEYLHTAVTKSHYIHNSHIQNSRYSLYHIRHYARYMAFYVWGSGILFLLVNSGMHLHDKRDRQNMRRANCITY